MHTPIGKYDKFYDQGVYQCVVCHQDLFSSDTKYDSGCGWPAFNDGKQIYIYLCAKNWATFDINILVNAQTMLHKD